MSPKTASARPAGLRWAIAASVAAHAVAGALLIALPHGGGADREGRVVEVRLLTPPVAVVAAAAVPPPPAPPRPIMAAAAPAAGVESAPTAQPPAALPPPRATRPESGAERGASALSGAAPGPPGAGRDAAIATLDRRLVDHCRYPLQARRRGIEGRVGLRFRVMPDGNLAGAEVSHSSGSSLLDRAALHTLDGCFPLDLATARLLAGEPIAVDLSFRLVEE